MFAAPRRRAALDRLLHEETEVDCAFSTAIDNAIVHLTGLQWLRVPLLGSSRLVVEKSIASIAKREPDKADPGRRHDALAVWLTPSGLFPFPRMRVLVMVRPYNAHTILKLEAHYHPPLGQLGALLDSLWGKFVAAWTLRTLQGDLRAALESAWSRERQGLAQAI